MDLEELQAGTIILIDKPLDWTSFDVVNKTRLVIRKEFKIKKIKVGHAGTLDPRATGLLILCTGRATKQIEQLQGQSKVYSGTFKLGFTTASYDTETEEENACEVPNLSLEELTAATKSFLGEIQQYPPIHSAIKKGGRRLYEYARRGQEVELPPRFVRIDSFEITAWNPPFVSFVIHCGKGTYIRSLAHDFGKALGCGGYLSTLRREKIGDYSVQDVDNSWIEKP